MGLIIGIHVIDGLRLTRFVSKIPSAILTSSLIVVSFCVSCGSEKRISKLINNDLSYVDFIEKKRTYYRGVTNSKYSLIPSIYRNLAVDNKGAYEFSYNSLKKLYSDINLQSKYSIVFDSDIVDYSFCAFAQHSISYSRFLDFTEEIKVALSFATNNWFQLTIT
ncbi:MAG: FRG domain-containing protein [Firmicutes bacterium]|nr:FRG domain-containing protein [Candidatus Colivicinus equi]